MKEISIKVKRKWFCGGCENRAKNAFSYNGWYRKSEKQNYQTGMVTVIAKQEILEAVIERKITDLWF